MATVVLEGKLIKDIYGNFYVPSYQRGYRWGKDEVERLLDDIYFNGPNNYCLQPIVVKKHDDRYELIDGQQRLTTIYLIYKYMHNVSCGFLDPPKFKLTYETRKGTQEFLGDEIDFTRKEENIDFYYICNAYEVISQWFSKMGDKSVMTNINKYFDENVQIIWYEVDNGEDSKSLFTRLNIGKIPLTSAELIKSVLIINAKGDRKRVEISYQWDNIEKQLHNKKFWYFLTNNDFDTYNTKIDLILDIMANKGIKDEQYFTFFYFNNLLKQEDVNIIWREILNTFLVLKNWYENHDLYHKIGYLIASKSCELIDIYKESKNIKKGQFMELLDNKIAKSIEIKNNYGELEYEKKSDYDKISRLLLLFNVESVRQIENKTHRFPFDNIKYKSNKKVIWSLEHIHAQQSEGLDEEKTRKEWLNLHLESLKTIDFKGKEQLLDKIVNALARDKVGKEFDELQSEIVSVLSPKGSNSYMHNITNLALLNTADNAALNNSTFDVKRNVIIDMDKHGQYIPFCTKMVFLKYYTKSDETQIHFWGQQDRQGYLAAINNVLKQYLANKIIVEGVNE